MPSLYGLARELFQLNNLRNHGNVKLRFDTFLNNSCFVILAYYIPVIMTAVKIFIINALGLIFVLAFRQILCPVIKTFWGPKLSFCKILFWVGFWEMVTPKSNIRVWSLHTSLVWTITNDCGINVKPTCTFGKFEIDAQKVLKIVKFGHYSALCKQNIFFSLILGNICT